MWAKDHSVSPGFQSRAPRFGFPKVLAIGEAPRAHRALHRPHPGRRLLHARAPRRCCGDVPALETLAAVSRRGERLPEPRVRLVNVVDRMKREPQPERPHGLRDMDSGEFFTKDKPVGFARHAYPWSIRRPTRRRAPHDKIPVRGYKEERAITTPGG